ncbi:Glycosyltransferase sugar-binding region containing DXD motif-containing protein [Butyrivibrio sp. INlla18]|uniref:glycosyltransferase family 32 protein n=1 Tax=Butyrivibrio sp. INlla18 TaxID=1520806 RepID=UPI00087E2227|nr:glycosyltransferase [Butyrivibrio sp. INlla18]SDA41680.1 Glycosyltransferase sugar-binding region containing DXD motif-containing protein [Butyrivibrio sp. INlla18]
MNICDVTFRQFESEIRDKKIACIGAGKLLDHLLEFGPKDVVSKIELIADNNEHAKTRKVNNLNIECRSVDETIKLLDESFVILITTMYCKDIVDQINSFKSDLQNDCYIYSLMSLRVDEYEFPEKHDESIPKIIHWVWVGGGPVPDKNKKCIESWYKYCPDYEIKCWNEDNYDISKCTYMKQAYEAHKWGFVPDYLRLDVIYDYGGIYLDADVELVKPLDDLLFYDGFVGFQRNFAINLGLGFGCKAKNPTIRAMRDYYDSISFKTDSGYNLTASPVYNTRVLVRNGLIINNELQKVGDLLVFPTDVLDPKGAFSWTPKLTRHSYSVHHYDESWVNLEQKQINEERYKQTGFFRDGVVND